MQLHNSHQNELYRKITTLFVVFTLICTASYAGYTYLSDQDSNYNDQIATISHQIAVKSAESAREAKRKEPVYITLPSAKTIRAIVEDYSVDSSTWVLVSKTHAISANYTPTDLKIPNVTTRTDKSDAERSVRTFIEKPLINLFNAASNAGYQLMIGSGYRSAALQKVYFDSLAASVGAAEANQAIAMPGQSEHQTGLAVDISTIARNCYLDNCFGQTSDGLWLVNNAYKYGFTLRYPSGKESITGYQYESWHFRYVGIDLATALHESGLTLDEAWSYLVKAESTLKKNGAI